MKIKEGYMLRVVAGNHVVVPVGKAASEFNGIITLNSTGAFLWEKLLNKVTEEELVSYLMEEYDVDKEVAINDVKKFIDKLTGANIIE